ncbi:unnamed protein product [Clonostachys solani]|uniref:BZIP domain-containing protein n=1 Tax=Clonostachys solani TaxID=160281 RepID=A0A9N9W480_9HYPO|nr:unnamed protein product [Clonostachys solani]
MTPHRSANPGILLIPLNQMPHQVLTSNQREDWAGVVDQKQRKRLQNMLNQRAYRERRRNHTVNAAVLIPTESVLETSRQDADRKRVMLEAFSKQALESYNAGQPQADQLLGLLQLNFIRSLTSNASLLGLRVDWLNCNSLSHIGLIGPTNPYADEFSYLPETLIPTSIQSRTPHHPWIDLFPFPRMRDNLLIAAEGMSEEEEIRLWNDIVENNTTSSGDWTGLIVWGDPWNPWNWEVTEAFTRNWGWLLKGCSEVIHSSNHWRLSRGDVALTFDPINPA